MRGVLAILLSSTSALACASAASRDRAPAQLAPDAASLDELALEVVHLDGLDARVARLSSLHAIIHESLRAARLRDLEAPLEAVSAETTAQLDRIGAVARRVYDEGALRRELVAGVARRAGAPALVEVSVFFRGDAWQSLARARAYVMTAAGQRELALYLSALSSRPPDEARLARVRRLLAAAREVELLQALSHEASSSFLDALDGQLPDEVTRGWQEWKDGQEQAGAAFAQSIERTLLLQDYFAVRALDPDVLDEVLRFYDGEAGRWWAEARLAETRALVVERAGELKRALDSGA